MSSPYLSFGFALVVVRLDYCTISFSMTSNQLHAFVLRKNERYIYWLPLWARYSLECILQSLRIRIGGNTGISLRSIQSDISRLIRDLPSSELS